MNWIVFVYRVPVEPTRHRVAVWRHLRRIGAVSLQQSVAGLPKSEENLAALQQVVRTVEAAGGESFDGRLGRVEGAALVALFAGLLAGARRHVRVAGDGFAVPAAEPAGALLVGTRTRFLLG